MSRPNRTAGRLARHRGHFGPIASATILLLFAGCGGTPDTPPGPAPDGMAWIPGSTFVMGSEAGRPDEAPAHEVRVDGFWMDTTEVTVSQFAAFVEATGYVTVAERDLDPADFPGADPALLVPGSLCFTPPDHAVSHADFTAWWAWVPGANWRQPEGPGSSVEGRERHPVAHVAWDDAMAYAEWAGRRLATEAEWEFAARGGLEGARFTWGDAPPDSLHPLANIWQGRFPELDTAEDGFRGTAPVGSFAPNGYGLYDMAGNVWEWVLDRYRPDWYGESPRDNPRGPETSFDPAEPGLAKRVVRGGSFLCHATYCESYRPSARMKNSEDSATGHTGFRTVLAP